MKGALGWAILAVVSFALLWIGARTGVGRGPTLDEHLDRASSDYAHAAYENDYAEFPNFEVWAAELDRPYNVEEDGL